MLKKLNNFLRRIKKWWKEFKFIAESPEERYVLMKYGLGIVRYREIDGKTKNYIANMENNKFIIHGKSNRCSILFHWFGKYEKEGVIEWMPISQVTEKINKKYKKEVIKNFREGLEEDEYQVINRELPYIFD